MTMPTFSPDPPYPLCTGKSNPSATPRGAQPFCGPCAGPESGVSGPGVTGPVGGVGVGDSVGDGVGDGVDVGEPVGEGVGVGTVPFKLTASTYCVSKVAFWPFP